SACRTPPSACGAAAARARLSPRRARNCATLRLRCPGPFAVRTTTSKPSPGLAKRLRWCVRSPSFPCAMRVKRSACWPWAARIPNASMPTWVRSLSSAPASSSAPRSCASFDMNPAAPEADDPRQALVDAYLAHLLQQRRLSPATERGYRQGLRNLLQLAGDTPLDRLETHHVRRMVAQLHGRGLQPSTIAHMLSAWRGLYRWLARHHGYGVDPCAGVRAPKARKGLPKALSPEEARRLLDGVPEDACEARDKAMFELCYSSGLRLAELVSLDLHDGHAMLKQGEITVRGKGNKTRTVPVGRAALQAVEVWLAQRDGVVRGEQEALFLGAQGGRIAPSVVRARLK